MSSLGSSVVPAQQIPILPEPAAPANPGRRLVAFLVDTGLLVLLLVLEAFAAILITKVLVNGGDRPGTTKEILKYLFVTTYFIYYLASWGRAGATPGQRLLKLRVALASKPDSHEPVGEGRAFVRVIGYGLSSFLLIGFIMIFTNPKRRALHDFIAGTIVVKA